MYGFLAKGVRTTHSDIANVTPHCDNNTTPLLSPLCPVDLSTAEGSIYLSDKQDSANENLTDLPTRTQLRIRIRN